MASLLEIKKKIGSVKNMKKITKAMQLVAASKMKSFQDAAVSSRQYIYELLRIMHLLVEEHTESIYTMQRSEGASLFLLYTSDKGLCGSMNNQLTKGLMRSDAWNAVQAENRMLITVGRKASDFARIENISTEKEFQGLPEKFEMIDMLPIISHVLELWHAETVKDVYIVVPHFVNAFTFYPKVKQLLPFSRTMIAQFLDTTSLTDAEHTQKLTYMYYEPSPNRVFDMLYQHIFTGACAEAMYELKATEYSSRMLAMQNATDAADTMIHEKTLIYNKIRQTNITQQISEMVNAAEALS